MADILPNGYATLDRPEICLNLFHPRPEWDNVKKNTPFHNVLIPVDADAVIGGRLHMDKKTAPNILFFHGNGEIVADYDEMGPLYNRLNVNFLPVDYRGYGRSTGTPTVTTLMQDCYVILDFIEAWLKNEGFSGPLIVMGRSLGSAPALELASNRPDRIAGLIIESGFAYTGPLLTLLGVDTRRFDFDESLGFGNLEKMRKIDTHVLIIHAELDHIIPLSDGNALFDACPSQQKALLTIPMANHNDIFARGLEKYMAAVQKLAQAVVPKKIDGDM